MLAAPAPATTLNKGQIRGGRRAARFLLVKLLLLKAFWRAVSGAADLKRSHSAGGIDRNERALDELPPFHVRPLRFGTVIITAQTITLEGSNVHLTQITE
jgi:hypothetical protein